MEPTCQSGAANEPSMPDGLNSAGSSSHMTNASQTEIRVEVCAFIIDKKTKNVEVLETQLDRQELLALLPGIFGELCELAEQRLDLVHQDLSKGEWGEQQGLIRILV